MMESFVKKLDVALTPRPPVQKNLNGSEGFVYQISDRAHLRNHVALNFGYPCYSEEQNPRGEPVPESPWG